MNKNFHTIIIGGGPAGLAASVECQRLGLDTLLIEREAHLGGILKQCIHDGFGDKLTGPEYAAQYIEQLCSATHVTTALFSFVTDITRDAANFTVTYINTDGVHKATAPKLILATGCRERPRNKVNIHGTRPAGVLTAGTCQHLINIGGMMPARSTVILGSGDIGLIMARRITFEGGEVVGVFEAKPTVSGLSRNVVQCLNDFDIPLYLSTTVTRVEGKTRLSGVYVSKVDDNMVPYGEETLIPCDSLILAVGLIPENEVAAKLNIPIDRRTAGPYVDQDNQTLLDGVFCCGNALNVNDLVTYVSDSGVVAARGQVGNERELIDIHTDSNILYAVPSKLNVAGDVNAVTIYFRSSRIFKNKTLTVTVDGIVIFSKIYRQLLPPEMERITIDFTVQLTKNSIISITLA
jgi:NADPH-dependent 2,4-dienoyl-CoA reductase/sulfur reductase-like enzyme